MANHSPSPPSPQYSHHPALAAAQYALEPGVPILARAVIALAAMDCGTGDGYHLCLSPGWFQRLDALLDDEYPDIDTRELLRLHLSHVCQLDIDGPVERVTYPRVPVSTGLALSVFEKDGYQCLHCGTRKNLTVDHIIPVSRGGTNDPDNLQTLCRSCNSRKGARL